ncbi:haloacid dehalogenase-like hydrolase [Bordetella pertussis]|uniref:Phosphoglycolate phosphatase n=6 Tax=Bordetella TaxID=517 RepID=A0A0E7UHK9_BORPT|nr:MULTISPECIES: HAD hydrolase-like protein [Bordetella]ETH40445.1 haloacid dehalogenase-like hydrolase [Bordetella pertussis H918]ETH43678.1 haloacid dehalogenase-like hydrolase [Bordetella pertussis H939]ETH49332.1 haloacid dehalogenase-like hydrolase [Bordetella pertussis H921]ETH72814.1 haloacid dehalogenase-like hydrolase [Bordetella pertussis STO1-CHLA-0011]ETH82798.1 haloacid dehalogenase-like hydrolase [Bordetella pertussis STO1-CHOC-0017]ETH87432.1 haloacid dehalogenase-like hydrolas
MKYRLAAFDFDGTLADTLPWFESVMDGVADKYGFRKASAADKAQLRHRSTREIMAFLEVPVWKLPAIMAHVRQLMREIDPAVRMFAGVPAALAQLKAAGLRLAVCSSNSLDNVRRVLGPQTGALIDDYECGADLFGKPAKLARLMARHGVERTRCILIGDEMRDIDAARKAGVMAGSVAWGYNHVDALRARAPDEIFEQVADLAAVLAPGFPSFPPTP